MLQVLIALMFYSLWVAIALFGIDHRFDQILPGYTMGHCDYWDLGAALLSFILAHLVYRKWGGVKFRRRNGKTDIMLNKNYFRLQVSYSVLFSLVALWQFLSL